jgi:predicted acylesterase/phospholipase RssA
MFLILLTFSFGLAWQYHELSIAPFMLALYAAFSREAWHQCSELGSAILRMRVPVIVALLAFAIYTNDQILEVLAMPYQTGARSAETVPLLSFIATATALWLWARFFSWFEEKTPAGTESAEGQGASSWWYKFLPWLLVIALLAFHPVLFMGIQDVIGKAAIPEGFKLGIAVGVTAFSFISWLYFACIFNKHLPFTNNLPEALEKLPYHLQVRTVLLRLFPIVLPSLLAAATVYNVLPRVDPAWSNFKLLWAAGTFLVLYGVGFLVDDVFVRLLYRQNAYVRHKLGPGEERIRDSIGRVLKGYPRRFGPGMAYFLELLLIFALAAISLVSRFRLGFVAAANLLVNAALGLGFARFLKTNQEFAFDTNLWNSYFGDIAVPEELAVVRRKMRPAAKPENSADADTDAEAQEPASQRPLAHLPSFLKLTDLFGLLAFSAAGIILATDSFWSDPVLRDNAYYLVAAIFVLSLVPFLPILAAFFFLVLIVFSPVTFFIGPFVDAVKLSPSSQTLLVINIFIVASLGFFALLLLFSYRRPLIGLFFGLIVLLATFDLNDNHAIPRPAEEAQAIGVQPVADSFKTWLDKRLKRWPRLAEGSKYPVYIVAAEGGGAYAALHAALFLAEAQDEFPEFADHLFAISGVSGGSVGASVFASLLHSSAGEPSERRYRDSTIKFFKSDLLTPVVTATLFHDTIARLIPCLDYFCPTSGLDRAREFERALERTWDERLKTASKPFALPLTELWSPDRDVPALLLNTTEVETGERVVLAPFPLQKDVPTLNALIDRDPQLNIKLSTASGLSARFPGLTAPGWFKSSLEKPAFKHRLVDGGYFENSGVATAFDLLTSLEKSLAGQHQGQVELVLISLKLEDSVGTVTEPPHSFHEIMTPFRTLNNTRAARGKLALDQASLALDGTVCRESASAGSQAEANPSCFYTGRVRVSVLENDENQPLPLGWLLSDVSKGRIEESVGRGSECPRIQGTGLKIKERNACVLRQIGTELSVGIEVKGKPSAPAWTTEVH